jgi:poly-beta-1,6-N-acetyl-D-glucosamine synthase
MSNDRYAVITPAHNEARFLPRVIESMAQQEIRPLRWIIVDDRSTDETWDIIQEAAARYDFIKAFTLRGDLERRLGAQVVRVIREGYRRLDVEVDFLVKMDADIVLPHDYFGNMMKRFAADPKLGIASGKGFVEHQGEWIRERCPDFHVPGFTKMYRKSCFDDIGGWIEIYGWDILDGAKARMRGWKTRSFNGETIYHLRLMGSARGMLRGHIGHGRGMWAIRSNPLFVLARSVYRAFEVPYFAGLMIFGGYIWGALSGEPRLQDRALGKFLRKEQVSRLMGRRLREEEFLVRRLGKRR